MPDHLIKLAENLSQALLARQWLITTAESCTGGWVAQILTAIEGSSQWFDRGFVCYSNQAKTDMLGVTPELILQYGAVSEEVATAMVEGALQTSQAQLAMAITGIAGPGGGSVAKPVGTVWFGLSVKQNQQMQTTTYYQLFRGDRQRIRYCAVQYALTKLYHHTQLV